VVADAPRDDKPRHNRRGDNASRDRFADTLRESHSGGRISKRDFKSHLGKLSDPPAALRDVTVVLVGTKKAGNVGAIARACGSFECEDFRVVSPRCDPKTRASLSAAKGAQHIVHGAGVYDTLEDALLDVDKAVAFHVWCDGLEPERARDVDALIKTFPGGRGFFSDAQKDDEVHFETDEETSPYPRRDPDTQNPVVPLFVGARRARIRGVSRVGEDANETREDEADKKKNDEAKNDETSETSDVVVHGWRRRSHVTEPANRAGRGSGKLALVFGREVEGLTDDEVNACDAVCAIPTGRLIESLSVSHAAVIILSQYYQSRRGGEEE
jgi:tRNA C32,U32 (ribose-2'-O)-methylase TrmJ